MALFGRALFWLLCIAVGLLSFRFLALGLEAAFQGLDRQFPYPDTFLTHVIGASVALMLMPFQFWKGLRARRPDLHRWTGRVYVLAVLAAGIAALNMATRTITGPVAGLGFFILGVLWIGTTLVALHHARGGRIARHRRWMMRSAALTFAAVTLRVYLPLSLVAGLDFDSAYTVIAWACWVPNLLVMELWLNRRPALA